MRNALFILVLMIPACGDPNAILPHEAEPAPPIKSSLEDFRLLGIDHMTSPGGRFTIRPVSDWVMATTPEINNEIDTALTDSEGRFDDGTMGISISQGMGVQCRHAIFSHNQIKFEETGMSHKDFFEMTFSKESAERTLVTNIWFMEEFVLYHFERVGGIDGLMSIRHEYEWLLEVDTGKMHQGFGEIELVDDVYRVLTCSSGENISLASSDIEQMRFQMRDSVHVGPRPIAKISDVSEAL